MGFIEAIKSGHAKTFHYSGRSSRSEFWWFQLYTLLYYLSLLLVIGFLPFVFVVICGFYGIWLALCVFRLANRRYHDIGRSGFWATALFITPGLTNLLKAITDDNPTLNILFLIPLILLVPLCFSSEPHANRYGSPSFPAQNTKTLNMDSEPVESVQASVWRNSIKLLDRWSIRGILLGFLAGILYTFSQGYTQIGFMIGFGIPFAAIFGLIGAIIDFFKFRNKNSIVQ